MVEVTRSDAIKFLEHACRNWSPFSFDEDDLRDFQHALEEDRNAHREAGRRAGLEEAAGIARKYDCRGNNDSARNMAAIIRNAIRVKIGDGHDA